MTYLTLHLPDSFESEKEETIQFIAAKLYEAGRLSLGQTAKLCDTDKRGIAAILAKFGVDYLQYKIEELLHDMETLKRF